MNFLVKIPSNFRGTYPLFGKALIVTSGVLLFFSGYNYFEFNNALK